VTNDTAESKCLQPWTTPDVWPVLGAPTTTLILAVTYCSGLLLWDYVRITTRQLYEVGIMLPLISILEFVEASLAQVATYVAITLLVILLRKWTGRVALLPLLLATPLLGILTWFGYEHFVPSYRWYTDERPPYEYGLTLERFLIAWGLEILVVLGVWWPLRTRRELRKASS
jgi:hypothetical protein